MSSIVHPARGLAPSPPAGAGAYWLAPTLVRRLGGVRAARDRASLAVLCGHAEQMLDDVGRLSRRAVAGEEVPTLTIGAEVELDGVERRSAFLSELSETFEALATKYGAQADRERPPGKSFG